MNTKHTPTEQKHSPLPWNSHHRTVNMKVPYGSITVAYCEKYLSPNELGEFKEAEIEEAKANAAFIAKACNSHYELVEALEDLIQQIECNEGDGIIKIYRAEQVLKKVRAR